MPYMAPSAEHLRVLVADDDAIFVSLAEACLLQSGHTVHSVRDGSEAIEALNSEIHDVALIDLSMPRIDGFRLVALIRSTPRLEHLPIIVMSIRTDAAAVEEAYRLGADAFETKPVNWSLFPFRMQHIVRRSMTFTALKSELANYRRIAASGGSSSQVTTKD